MLLDGIIQFSAAAVCMWGMSIYKNTIKASLGVLCINMIYWYSYVEIYIKKTIFDYTPILDDTELSGGCMLYYIKDGRTVAMYDEPKHNHPIPFPEDMDALAANTHQSVGSAGIIGAHSFLQELRALEQAAKAGDTNGAKAHASAVQLAWPATQAAIRALTA